MQRAIGIEYLKDGTSFRIDNIRRDVIIAAGVLVAECWIQDASTEDFFRYIPDTSNSGTFRDW